MNRFVVASVSLFTVLILAALFSFLAYAADPWTNGQDAYVVIGQPDFTSTAGGVTTTTLNAPADVALDLDQGKMYVLDGNNHRVLRYSYPITGNQPAAELVFGQPDFTSNAAGTTQNTFNFPRGLTVDESGRLWVGELSNARVVWFDAAYAITSNQPDADGVLGQPDFTSSTGTTTQAGMANGYDMVVDAAGTLFVADAGNHRVLRFDDAANKANGADADGVLGQPDFTSNTSATTQSGMNAPRGVALSGASLFVADRSNSRVLRFDDAANKANGADADGVLGQPDFTSNTITTTQSGMSNVARVAVDAGGRLYVSDIFSNQRILIFNDAVSLANGAPADYVIGQPDFTSSGGGTGADRINSDSSASGLAVDNENNRLFFADSLNNRALGYQASAPLGIPELAIAKSGPANAAPNEPLTYTLTISNSGSLTATALVITDVVPTDAEYLSGGTLVSGSVVSWTVGSLAVDQQEQVQFTVRATETITNSVYGVSFAEGEPVTGVETVVTEIESFPDMAIAKSGPANAAPNEPLTYTLTISNSGYVPATSVVVTDSLPAGAEYLSGGTLISGSVVSWTVGTLPAGGQAQVQFAVRATETITNSVYGVSFAEGAPVTGVDAVVTEIEGLPDMAIAKSGPAGAMANEPLTYTLTISNSGYVPATSVVVTDTLPAGAEYLSGGTLVSGSVVSWTVGSLAVDQQEQVQFTVRATETITNSVYGVSFAEGAPVTGVEAVVTEIESFPDMAIAKSGPAGAMANEPLTYTLTISNSGYVPATSVVVTDSLPAGAEYLSGGTLSGSVVSWTVGTLPAGGQAQVQFAVRATETITNSIYGVSFAEGQAVMGAEPLITEIDWWTHHFPVVLK